MAMSSRCGQKQEESARTTEPDCGVAAVCNELRGYLAQVEERVTKLQAEARNTDSELQELGKCEIPEIRRTMKKMNETLLEYQEAVKARFKAENDCRRTEVSWQLDTAEEVGELKNTLLKTQSALDEFNREFKRMERETIAEANQHSEMVAELRLEIGASWKQTAKLEEMVAELRSEIQKMVQSTATVEPRAENGHEQFFIYTPQVSPGVSRGQSTEDSDDSATKKEKISTLEEVIKKLQDQIRDMKLASDEDILVLKSAIDRLERELKDLKRKQAGCRTPNLSGIMEELRIVVPHVQKASKEAVMEGGKAAWTEFKSFKLLNVHKSFCNTGISVFSERMKALNTKESQSVEDSAPETTSQ